MKLQFRAVGFDPGFGVGIRGKSLDPHRVVLFLTATAWAWAP